MCEVRARLSAPAALVDERKTEEREGVRDEAELGAAGAAVVTGTAGAGGRAVRRAPDGGGRGGRAPACARRPVGNAAEVAEGIERALGGGAEWAEPLERGDSEDTDET